MGKERLSERHLRDIAGIIQARKELLDTPYERWVAVLGLDAQWALAQQLVSCGEPPGSMP